MRCGGDAFNSQGLEIRLQPRTAGRDKPDAASVVLAWAVLSGRLDGRLDLACTQTIQRAMAS
jgi:hypothetical protein